MTTDTSREAVEDLIAEAQVITGNPFPPMSNRDATLIGRMQDTLAALLDERDEAAEQRERADRLTAKLDAVKALCEKESGEIRTRYEPDGPYTGYANACDDVLAILADTDEGKSEK